MKQLIEGIGILALVAVMSVIVACAWGMLTEKTGWEDED